MRTYAEPHRVDLERQYKEKTMGRPVNPRFLGATGDNSQPTIPVRFHDGSNLIEGKILTQRGTNKFNCSNDGDTITRVCRLVNEITPNANNECAIVGIADGGTPKLIKKMFNRTCVDWDDNRYTWEVQDDSTESLLVLTAI